MTTYVSAGFAWGSTNNQTVTLQLHRDRISHLHAAILGAGLVQTADTGQLDPQAAAVPGANLSSGFTVYRFNDSRQGVDPLFMRVDWFVGGFSNLLSPRITTGTGTNGSGTLTGQVSATATAGGSTATADGPITSLQTYSCHTDGYFLLFCGPNNTGAAECIITWTVARTKDAGGAFDSLGNVIWTDGGYAEGGGRANFTRTLNNQFAGLVQSHYCIAPGYPNPATLVNGDLILYPHFYADPDVKQMWWQFTVLRTDFTFPPTTFTASPMYNAPRTFVGSYYGPKGENLSAAHRAVFLWE